jgi:hypothetical protein
MAVTGLFDYPEPIHLYKTEAWSDLVSNLVTFFATLVLGAELGIGDKTLNPRPQILNPKNPKPKLFPVTP